MLCFALVSALVDRFHTHRYTATVAVTAFSAKQQRSDPSADSYGAFLHSLCPAATRSPDSSTQLPCAVCEYVDMVESYADMYDTVHRTSELLLRALLTDCGRVLATASSVPPAVAAVQHTYLRVWSSGCGRDSDREQQLDRRWKEDVEWRKAQSGRAAQQRKVETASGTKPAESGKKAKKSARKR